MRDLRRVEGDRAGAASGRAAGRHALEQRPQPAGRGTIALFIPSLAIGGAERQALQLARGLAARWRVVLLTATPEWSPAEDDAGLTHIWTGRRKGAALVARLAVILKRERIDIIQAYLLGSQAYALAARALVRNVRLIVAVRASLGLEGIVGWSGKVSHALVFGCRHLVDQYVFNSAAGERQLGGSLPPDRRRVIYNGIDTTRFRPDPDATAYVRGLTEAPEGTRLVGIVANVNPHKGHEIFVRAAAIIAGRIPDVWFVVIGDYDSPLGRRLLRVVTELSLVGRFRFLGPRTDPERIIPALDVVCSTSFSEGFSNAVGEAMACGVPCVVTAAGDSPVIVGETGIVVPPGDAPALAAALTTLLEGSPGELRQRGRAARQRIEQNFGVRRMVQDFENLYESMLPVRQATDQSVREQ